MTRIASVMRRRSMDKIPVKVISIGNLTLDILAAQAFVNGVDLLLKPKEFALLRLLAQNENATMSAETLYEEVWKSSMAGDDRTLRKHMSELRNKLNEKSCSHTVTAIYGKGYCFEKA